MRNLLILVLGAAVIWLLIERDRLTDELAAVQEKATELEEQTVALKGPGGVGAPGSRAGRSWLDEHIDRGAKALENAPGKGYNRR